MYGRGRKSAASQNVVPLTLAQRLKPPPSLTPSQRALWRKIVASKPADWFNEDSGPLLEAYCKVVMHYRHWVRLLDAAPPAVDMKAMKELHDMEKKQVSLMHRLASALRLTPQSRYTPQTAAAIAKRSGGVTAIDKPWDDDE
jgi:phage terminase small subunit